MVSIAKIDFRIEHNGNLTSIYNYLGIVKNVYHENFTQVINKIYNDDILKKI